jgi:hypothetical protein
VVPASVVAALDAAVEGDCAMADSADVDPLLHAARVSTPAAHRAAPVTNLVGTVRVGTFRRGIVGSW